MYFYMCMLGHVVKLTKEHREAMVVVEHRNNTLLGYSQALYKSICKSPEKHKATTAGENSNYGLQHLL